MKIQKTESQIRFEANIAKELERQENEKRELRLFWRCLIAMLLSFGVGIMVGLATK